MRGVRARGGKELEKYLMGEVLTARQTVLARCYDCCCGYVDGKLDCHIKTCPCYFFMPYRKIKPDRTKKPRSEKQVKNDRRFGAKSSRTHQDNIPQELKVKKGIRV